MENKNLEILRHSCAHLMAQAVKELYPNVKVAIGPAIEDGFYYDFDFADGVVLNEKDFKKIEQKMSELVKKGFDIVRKVVSKNEAMQMFADEPYKMEIIADLPEDSEISVYYQGNFFDLCRGPHLENTKEIGKAFKLMKIAGAYWKGDSKNKMLTRIYATAWENKDDLSAYLLRLEEAKKRDHRKLAKEMDLFHFEPEFAPGHPFYHPRGLEIFNKMTGYMKEVLKPRNYIEIATPRVMNRSLWETSGHWDKYGAHNFSGSFEDGNQFCVRPMNCPGGMLFFKQGIKTYKDLPMKVAEFGQVNRFENAGSLHGLMRVREFTQDDAHIFCTKEQLQDQVIEIMNLVKEVFSTFGFKEFEMKLATRPENRIGDDSVWDLAEEALKKSLDAAGVDYELNEGDGAFYGPKIDFYIKDAIGRQWQLGTVQLDMNLPERFDLNYIGEDGEKHRPIMLHRALFGSLERFMGILIENYSGHLPLWLSPEVIRFVPIADRHNEYAEKIAKIFADKGIKVDVDTASVGMQKKIKQAQVLKVPYIAVIGDSEMENNQVALRISNGNKQIQGVAITNLLNICEKQIENRENLNLEDLEKALKT